MFFSLSSLVFSQNKKDMEAKIARLDSMNAVMANDNQNLKIQVGALMSSVNLLTSNNINMDKRIAQLEAQLASMKNATDSLLQLMGKEAGATTIRIPETQQDSIKMIIQQYFSAPDWSSRLAYVLNPEKVRPMMEAYYSDGYKPYTAKTSDIYVKGNNIREGEMVTAIISSSRTVYLKKTSGTFKIDWEATAGYNPVSLTTFKAMLSATPEKFRVYATLGSYYNFDYSEAQRTHWNVSIEDNSSENIDACYVSKTSAAGTTIYNILKDGKKHQMILEIKIDDPKGRTAIINRFISEGWSQ